MTTRSKGKASGQDARATRRRMSASASRQLEAYLQSREIIRRIKRTVSQFPPGSIAAKQPYVR